MMLAIENLVRTFETLLTRTASTTRDAPPFAAANDNAEMEEAERQWAAYR